MKTLTRCRRCGCFAVAWKTRKNGSFYLGFDKAFKGNMDRGELAYFAKVSRAPHSCEAHRDHHGAVAEALSFDAMDVAGYDMDDYHFEEWERGKEYFEARGAELRAAMAESERFNAEWVAHKNEFAVLEREQEAAAFMAGLEKGD